MIAHVFAPDYDSLVNKPPQFAADGGARTDIQQKELFQRQGLLLFFRISDLDDNIEIDDGFQERQLLLFKLPDFFQSSE